MSDIGQITKKQIAVRDNGIGIPIYLNRIAAGRKMQIDRLPLYRLDDNNRPARTNYFLTGTLSCKSPGKFYFELQPKFGPNPPREASIKVQKSGLEPNSVVRNGKPVQVIGLPFEVAPGQDKVVFRISTDGWNNVPKILFTLLRDAPPAEVDDGDPTVPTGFPTKITEDR